jgi:cold shock CspA family protein
MVGIVDSFIDGKGKILCDLINEVVFERKDILSNVNNLHKGTKIEFDVIKNKYGFVAKNINLYN